MTKILYSIKEAAEQLSMHPDTLRRYIHAGYLPLVKHGRVLRVRHKDLEAISKLDLPSAWSANRPWKKERESAGRIAS